MNPRRELTSIVVHVDASPATESRIAAAHELAALHGADLDAVFGGGTGAFDLPFAMAEGAAAALPALLALCAERQQAARAMFDRAGRNGSTTMRWVELVGEPLVSGFAARAFLADLIVVGQPDPDALGSLGVPAQFVASVLIASGRPALVVPRTVRGAGRIARQPLIAWKPSREAARAVAGALPLLRRAERLHVTGQPSLRDASPPSIELERFLRRHGVEVPIEHHESVPDAQAGCGLLAMAQRCGADLLVMGCYGHSRARELVLGGASRTVLADMTIDVLMAH